MNHHTHNPQVNIIKQLNYGNIKKYIDPLVQFDY